MPVTANCSCGKIFKVKDEFAGTQVKCQVCGREILVPTENATALEEAPPVLLAPAPEDAQATITCPSCAEQIPKKAARCPLCKALILSQLSPEDFQAGLAKCIEEVDAHLADPAGTELDTKLKGKKWSTSLLIFRVLTVLCGVMLVSGFCVHNGEGLIGMGIIFGVIFGLVTLALWCRDRAANSIQQAATADVAYRRFYGALRSGWAGKAYAALAPAARKVGQVETLKFKNPKIPSSVGRFAINDVPSFAAYWKSIFRGPRGQQRAVRLKKVRILEEHREYAVVEASVNITNYPSWLILTVLISIWICVILILIMQKKEDRVFRKVLVRSQGRWFFAEGELEGSLDLYRTEEISNERRGWNQR
jgi:hypothetical protein